MFELNTPFQILIMYKVLLLMVLFRLFQAQIRLRIEETQTTQSLNSYLTYGLKTFNDYNFIFPFMETGTPQISTYKLEFKNKVAEKISKLQIFPILNKSQKSKIQKLIDDFLKKSFFEDLENSNIVCENYFDDCKTSMLKNSHFSHLRSSTYTENLYFIFFFGTTIKTNSDFEQIFEIEYQFSPSNFEDILNYVYTTFVVIIFYNIYAIFQSI